MLRGATLNRPEPIGVASAGTSPMTRAALVLGALPDQAFADSDAFGMAVGSVVGIGGQKPQARLVAFVLIKHALLRVDQHGELGEQDAPDGREVALTLQHVGEAGEIRLQPVLLGIALGRQAQITDHRIDVVLELRHLAAGVDLNGAGEITLGDGCRHLGDGAHLGGEIGRKEIDVAGEVLPGAGRTGNVGLAAQAALDAHLARHARHLIGEDGQRIGHVVDGLGQGRDLALRFDREVLLQIAVGHRAFHGSKGCQRLLS